MSGYLRRALSRGFGAVEASNAPRPFVRSASPIADMDQRIGLSDFDPFAASLSPRPQEVDGFGEGLGRPVPPGDPGVPTTFEKRASVFQVAPPRVASAGFGHEAAAAGPMVAGAVDSGARQPSRGPSASSRREGRSPSVTKTPLGSSRNTSVPGLVRDVLPQAPVSPQTPGDGTADRAPGDGFAPVGHPGPSGERSTDRAAGAGRETVHDSEFSAALENPVLPKPFAAPGAASPYSDAAAPNRGHAPPVPMFRRDEIEPGTRTASAPRVVIGELNVEVVAPTAPGSQGPAPPRTPATAASVSQIGPLSSGLAARQRLAMRGR